MNTSRFCRRLFVVTLFASAATVRITLIFIHAGVMIATHGAPKTPREDCGGLLK
jgi:hypothetical protein